jgi:hypothetical protein
MTVVGWDHNLTFGVSNRPGGAGGGGAPAVGGDAGRWSCGPPAGDPLRGRRRLHGPRGGGEAGSLLDASTPTTEEAAIAAYVG